MNTRRRSRLQLLLRNHLPRWKLRAPPRFSWKQAVGVLVLCVIVAALWPLPVVVRDGQANASVRILDRHGQLLFESRRASIGYHQVTPLSEVPSSLIQILIATEDRAFFNHSGIRPTSILRAWWQNFNSGETVSGGSTLTQQLVRIRTNKRSGSLLRKLQEAWYALKLERYLSKSQILSAYLNEAYFGHGAYGIGSAAKVYLGKSIGELTIGEQCLLIGLLQSPSRYDPFVHPVTAKQRRARVAAAAVSAGVLSNEQLSEIAIEPMLLRSSPLELKAPHFAMWIESLAHTQNRSGTLYTTLDAGLQRQIESAMLYKLAQLADKNVTSGAVVVLDAQTGDILAMVGSSDYFATDLAGQVNVALALRQPGSTLKPFTYALALEKGDTLATTVADVQTTFATKEGTPYIPRNYDYREHGLVRYREALANSYNIAAVRVLERVGVGQLLSLLEAAGITSLTEPAEHYGLALTLGAGEVSLLELTQAYGALARGGVTLQARSELSAPIQTGKRILSAETAWLITSTLQDNLARAEQFGTESVLKFDFPVAVKTGTSRNSRDNWVVGYTPDVVVGVWVGNADNTPMRGTSGVTGAGPIFHEVMLLATNNQTKRGFAPPSNITSARICSLSGLLPSPECLRQTTEYFQVGTAPTSIDSMHQRTRIDMRNGLLALSTCPPNTTTERLTYRFPLEIQAWARDAGYTLTPDRTSPLCNDTDSDTSPTQPRQIQISQPDPGDVFELDPTLPNDSERITFTARATGVEQVEWLINGNSIGTASGPNFRITWPAQVGTWHVVARGNNTSDERTFTVVNRHANE